MEDTLTVYEELHGVKELYYEVVRERDALKQEIETLRSTLAHCIASNSKKRQRETELITSGEKLMKLKISQRELTRCPVCGQEDIKRNFYKNKKTKLSRHDPKCGLESQKSS
jgi:predicted RNA-binding Zn-ribbon protein involved in translation (DUF1610 family)